MEWWNKGILGQKMGKFSILSSKPSIPTFLYSIIPIGSKHTMFDMPRLFNAANECGKR